MTDDEALTEIIEEQPVGTYLLMTLKPGVRAGFHRNSVCRKTDTDTWIEYKQQLGDRVMVLYTTDGIVKGLMVGQHSWAFS